MTMTRIEKRIARAAFDAMYPGDPAGRVKTGIADGDIEGFLDELARSWEWIAFATLRAGLLCVALASFVVARTLRPFWSLSRDERRRVLDALYKGDNYYLRQLVTMQKATAGFLYGAMIREAIAPGKPAAVDLSLVEWRRLVPKDRSASSHEGERSSRSSMEAA
jgi:hypothetical protein